MRWTPWVAAVAFIVLLAGPAAAVPDPGGRGVCTTETLEHLDNPPVRCDGPTAPPAPSPSSTPQPDAPDAPAPESRSPPRAPSPDAPSPNVPTHLIPDPTEAGPSASPEPPAPSPGPAPSTTLPPAPAAADPPAAGLKDPPGPVEVDACSIDSFPWGPVLPFPSLAPSVVLRKDASCETAEALQPEAARPPAPAIPSEATVRAPPTATRSPALAAAMGALLLAVAWLFYSRVQADGVVGHPRRAAILEALRHEPGLSVQDLSKRFSIHWSRIEYHVRRLRLAGHLVQREVLGRTALFRADDPQRGRQDQLALLRRPRFARAHALLAVRPGLDQAGIASSLGLHQSQASRMLRTLHQAGLVVADASHRPVRYSTAPSPATLGAAGPASRSA